MERLQKEPLCVIVGAGEYDDRFPLAEYLAGAKDLFLIAADGGLAILSRLSLEPDLIIGDFDSLGSVPTGKCVKVLPVEKDDTDTGAAVREGEARGYKTFLFLGCTGGRPDHTFAVYQTLAGLASRGETGYLIGDGYVATAIGNRAVSFPASAVGTVSVFAFGGVCRGVLIDGLQYSLRDATLTPDYPIGVSNRFIGKAATVGVRDGTLLIFTEGYELTTLK